MIRWLAHRFAPKPAPPPSLPAEPEPIPAPKPEPDPPTVHGERCPYCDHDYGTPQASDDEINRHLFVCPGPPEREPDRRLNDEPLTPAERLPTPRLEPPTDTPFATDYATTTAWHPREAALLGRLAELTHRVGPQEAARQIFGGHQ